MSCFGRSTQRNYLGSSEPVSVDSYGLGNVSNRLFHEHACCGARQPGRARVLVVSYAPGRR